MNDTIGQQAYRQFTKPSELHKAINMLRGIVAGISSSGDVNKLELAELSNWCILHSGLKDRHPFSEIMRKNVRIFSGSAITLRIIPAITASSPPPFSSCMG